MQIVYAALDAACLLGIFHALTHKHRFTAPRGQPGIAHGSNHTSEERKESAIFPSMSEMLQESQAVDSTGRESEQHQVDYGLFSSELEYPPSSTGHGIVASELSEQLLSLSIAEDSRSIDGRGLSLGQHFLQIPIPQISMPECCLAACSHAILYIVYSRLTLQTPLRDQDFLPCHYRSSYKRAYNEADLH